MVKFPATLILTAMLAGPRLARSPEPSRPEEPPSCVADTRLEHNNASLQRSLQAAIAEAGWQTLVDRNALAVGVVDLTVPGRHYYAGINDDQMVYAASLPKIAILLTVIDAANRGELRLTPEVEASLRRMIVASSNEDAATSAALVGLPAIADVVRDPRYCLYDEEAGGGLWMGHAYSRHAPYGRDPLFKITNGATTRQVARFYTMLDGGKLVSTHWSYRMLNLMGPPELGHKFVGGMRDRKGVDFLARKSGSWGRFHADSALIQHHGWRYVVVGLAETRHGENVMRELVRVVDDIIQRGEHRNPRFAHRDVGSPSS